MRILLPLYQHTHTHVRHYLTGVDGGEEGRRNESTGARKPGVRGNVAPDRGEDAAWRDLLGDDLQGALHTTEEVFVPAGPETVLVQLEFPVWRAQTVNGG